MNFEPKRPEPPAATPPAAIAVVHRVPFFHYLAWFVLLLIVVPSVLLLVLCAGLSLLAPAGTPLTEKIAKLWEARGEILVGSAYHITFVSVCLIAIFFPVVVYVLSRRAARGTLRCGHCGASLGANTPANRARLSQAGVCGKCRAALPAEIP